MFTLLAVPLGAPCLLPEKDLPILPAALDAGVTHFLTGDRRHFGAFTNDPGHTGGILIQTVAEFLAGLWFPRSVRAHRDLEAREPERRPTEGAERGGGEARIRTWRREGACDP